MEMMTVEGVYDYLMYVGKIDMVTVKTCFSFMYNISSVMQINTLEHCPIVTFFKIEDTSFIRIEYNWS